MKKTQITPLKLARYPELLTGPVRPIHWDVDPSTACDHSCRGCPYIYDGGDEGVADPMLGVVREQTAKKNRQLLDFNAFADFLDEASRLGCKAITFVGGGEPTMHPRFTRMMQLIPAFEMKFGVITHFGRKYNPDFFRALQQATWVRVSLNAGTRETYLKHQGKDDFNQALENIAIASAVHGIRIGVSFLVTEDNWSEIYLAAVVARDAGAAFLQYKPIIETGEIGATLKRYVLPIQTELSMARGLETDRFQVLDQWSGRIDELKEHAAQSFSGACHVPRFNPKLGANGVVYSCCELAYNDAAALGSIYIDSLDTILQRAGERCGQIDMARCPHCWDKRVNKLINEGAFDQAVPPPSSVDEEFV